jgi:DNA-binding winged helix-turn-helix (wHTH) protein/Tol biopolymer transport system component
MQEGLTGFIKMHCVLDWRNLRRTSVEEAAHSPRLVRFGTFEADLVAGELRKAGVKLKLTGQPFQVLAILLERPGEVVTREELQKRLWPDTFVDVDHNLNTAINKIREVLRDSAESPRFVETLPRRGYRFIASIDGVSSADQIAKVLQIGPKTWRTPVYYGRGILGVVMVTVCALALWKTVFRAPSTPKVLRFTALTNDGQVKNGAMATDGSRIYFTEVLPDERTRILQVSVKGGEAAPLSVPLKQPQVLDLSRDGTELLIANHEGNQGFSFWVQPVAGGSPRRVGTALVRGDARFIEDGTSIIYSDGHDVYSVRRDGSSLRKLLTIDSVPFGFQFSPDARVFRFTQFDYQVDSMAIMEAAADGTELHKMFGGCCGTWTSDGRFFIFQSRRDLRLDLWALQEERRFPWRKGDDKPIQLTAGPLNFQFPLPSKDGRQIFAIGGSDRAEVIRYDLRSGQFVPYLSGISAEGLAFSRDGQWVTYTSYPDNTLWRSRVDGSERLQLTFPPSRAFLPRWSPDGKQIAFNGKQIGFSTNLPDTTWNIYLVSSEGGTPQRLFPSEQSEMDVNWSPDGNSLAFGSSEAPNAPIFTIDLKSKRVSPLPGSSGLYSPHWSPDGRYIAAITTEHPHKLVLFDFATKKWTELFGSEMAYENWSRDGKYIYFQAHHSPAQDDVQIRIVRFRLSDRKIENIVDLRNVGRLTAGTITGWFGLAPDDSPLFARDISTSEIYSLEMNWP